MNHAKRVHRGMLWLDSQDPEWYTKVDTATLDLSSSSNCVCGQVFGSWNLDTPIVRDMTTMINKGQNRRAWLMGWKVMWFAARHGFGAEFYADRMLLEFEWVDRISARVSDGEVASLFD